MTLSAYDKMNARAQFASRMLDLVGPDVFEPTENWKQVHQDFMAGRLIVCRRWISMEGKLVDWEIES